MSPELHSHKIPNRHPTKHESMNQVILYFLLPPPLCLRTLTLREITHRSGWTRYLLKIHDRIISQHLTLRHHIKMIAIPIRVRATHRRTPLRVPVIRTQVRHHHNDRLPCRAARSAGRARRCSGGGELVAFPAACAAPG